MTHTLYLQRVAIGLLSLAMIAGWWIAVRQGSQLEAYAREQHALQDLMRHEDMERQAHLALAQTTFAMFRALETCHCDGDVHQRNRLWQAFQQQLAVVDRLDTERLVLFERLRRP